MVKSLINPENINYNESKDIEDEDIEYSSPLYDYELFDRKIEIALGKQRYNFEKYGVIYFPIYLVVNSAPKSKIGVFEVDSNNLINILDEEGDVKLSSKNILFYISKEFLNSSLYIGENDSDDENDEIEKLNINENVIINEEDIELLEEDDVMTLKIPSEKLSKVVEESEKKLTDGIFTINEGTKAPPLLLEETKEDTTNIKQSYNESSRNNWIQKFMKNPNYDIIDNEGSGDCFFAVIRDAFQQFGKVTSVEKLRALLAKEATDNVFTEYRTLYLNFLSEFQSKEKDIKDMKKTITLLKKRIEQINNKPEHALLLEEAKKLVQTHKRLLVEKKEAKELLDEFAYMKDVDDLEKFREFMMTRDYWADTWAVSTLEKILNIKMIVLSEESYDAGDLDSVLNCGQLNDAELENIGQFKPDYYILTGYTGNHYQLINYKEKNLLKFREIPYDIKIMIINKCLEKNSGPYYLIEDFRNLKTKLGLNANEGKPEENDDEYLNNELYDKNTVFSFYSDSNSKAKAGKGSGEKIPDSELLKYNVLNSIKDWRKKLDDTWIAPFSLDGHRWNSVEHYFLASQFKKGFPDFYLKFSVDSGSDISKDIDLAHIAGNKTGRSKDRILRDKNITIDPDFYTIGVNAVYEEERKKALDAKFTQNLDLKQVLLETHNAKLVHFVRIKGGIPDMELMKLRKEF